MTFAFEIVPIITTVFYIMTKEEFLQLQELQRNSGLPLMKYLDQVGLKYSTYTYRMLTKTTKASVEIHLVDVYREYNRIFVKSFATKQTFLTFDNYVSIVC